MLGKAWACLKLAGPAMAVVYLSGCCMIGAGVGAMQDARAPDEYVFPGYDLVRLETGAEVNVNMRTGGSVRGNYQRVEYAPAPDFLEKYSLVREQEPPSQLLPALGDTVQVLMDVRGTRRTGEFAGFAGSRQVWLRVASAEEPTKPQLLLMRRIRDSRGRVLVADVVEGMLSQGRLPVASAMVLQTRQGDRAIAVGDIEDVRRTVKKRAVVYGFLVGAAFDALLIYAASTFTLGPLD